MIKTIEDWFRTLIVPQKNLGGSPICPFAKGAIENAQFQVVETTLATVQHQIQDCDIIKYKVVIFTLQDYSKYTVENLQEETLRLNKIFMLENKVVLDNDPRTPFHLNEVRTTYPNCYLWIVQDLEDLNKKSARLFEYSTYYKYWTQKQIDEVVTWRNPT